MLLLNNDPAFVLKVGFVASPRPRPEMHSEIRLCTKLHSATHQTQGARLTLKKPKVIYGSFPKYGTLIKYPK